MGATTAIIKKHSFHYVTNGGTISKSCSTAEQEQELTMIVSSSVITRDPINHPLPDQDILQSDYGDVDGSSHGEWHS